MINNKKGFTLIELIIVITIFTIISSFFISYIHFDTDENLIKRYYEDSVYRLKEIYNKILLGKGISNNLKYVKITCNSSEHNIFAYNCYTDIYNNISCKQIFFPSSYKSGKFLNDNGEKKGFLNKCGYYTLGGTRIDSPSGDFNGKFYYYIDTKFPYNVYKKLQDDKELKNYNNDINPNDNIDRFFIEIKSNELNIEKSFNL